MKNKENSLTPAINKNRLPQALLTLTKILKKAKKISILGVGSELMQDDNAGIDVSLFLEKKFGKTKPNVQIITGYTVPENFTGDIVNFNPEHIIIVDAADVNLKYGEFTLLPVERVTDFSLGTHKMSLIMMIKFIKETINPEFSVLAIQYKSVDLGGKMTNEVKKGVKNVSMYLSEIIEAL